jgi:hypothetical protein
LLPFFFSFFLSHTPDAIGRYTSPLRRGIFKGVQICSAVILQAYSAEPSNYFVLLILTDGVITDFEETKRFVNPTSSLACN